MPVAPARPALLPTPRGAAPQGPALSPQQQLLQQQAMAGQQPSSAPQSAPAPVTTDTVSLTTGDSSSSGHLGIQSSFDFSDEGDTAFVYPEASQDSYTSGDGQAWSAAGDGSQAWSAASGGQAWSAAGGGFEAYA